MKLYDAVGPHPRVVRMFLLEKGLRIPNVVLVLGTGEGRTAAHLARNPLGQVPVLETDDGQCISETVAICEYIEDLHPEPSLIGCTPGERGETRMWARRIDLNICEPIVHGYRFSPFGTRQFGDQSKISTQAALAMKDFARDNLAWLDSQLTDRKFLCGNRFSLADILLYPFIRYAIETGQILEPEWGSLEAWLERVEQRPSAIDSTYSEVLSMEISGTV